MKNTILLLIAMFSFGITSAQTKNNPRDTPTPSREAQLQQRTNQAPAIPNQSTATPSEQTIRRDNVINGDNRENNNAVRPSVSSAPTEKGIASPIATEPPSSETTTAPGGGSGTVK